MHRKKEKIEIRRHALKLRYWPMVRPDDEAGQVMDLNWSWVRALRNLRIGELRIDDVIGGYDNLRIIFFQGEPVVRHPLPVMWIIRVLQKKRDDFSAHELEIFRARRVLVMERFYNT
jgi:hypothetical protein